MRAPGSALDLRRPRVISVIAVIAVIAAIAHSRAQSADRAVGMRDNSGALNSAPETRRGAAARRQQKG